MRSVWAWKPACCTGRRALSGQSGLSPVKRNSQAARRSSGFLSVIQAKSRISARPPSAEHALDLCQGARVGDVLAGEGGDDVIEGVIGKGQGLGGPIDQCGGEALLAQPAPGLAGHLWAAVQADGVPALLVQRLLQVAWAKARTRAGAARSGRAGWRAPNLATCPVKPSPPPGHRSRRTGGRAAGKRGAGRAPANAGAGGFWECWVQEKAGWGGSF